MDAVKICPECSTENPVHTDICSGCAAMIDSVAPVVPPVAVEESAGGPEASTTREQERTCVRAARAKLTCVEAPEMSFTVRADDVVGRRSPKVAPDVDLGDALGRESMSRRHARFRERKGSWYLENVDPAHNKTWINGREITDGQNRLKTQDRVQLGDSIFIFEEQ